MIRAILGLFFPSLLGRVHKIPGVAIDSYPRRTHLQIEREEPFIFKVGDTGFECEIPPLTVDQATRLADFQATIRGQYKTIIDKVASDPKNLQVANGLKVVFYRSMMGWFYDLSKDRVPRLKRWGYRKALFRYLEENVSAGYKILNELLKFNSEIDSFFFGIPRVDDGTIQPPTRDGWRTIGRGRPDATGRGLLSSPILKIYDLIIYSLEENTIERMNHDKKEAEEKGS